MNPVFRLRSQMGLTQTQLAVKAGTSQPTIAAYESGSRSPTLETLERLAKSSGVELDISYVPPLTREEVRSLHYHCAVVEKLKNRPRYVLTKAREHIASLKIKHPDARILLERWEKWLDLEIEDLVNCCLSSSLLARDMRQVTPFAGLLSASERKDIIKRFQKEHPR